MALAQAGADVVVNYYSSAFEAAQLVESLPATQSGHIAVQGDAGAPAEIRDLIQSAGQQVQDDLFHRWRSIQRSGVSFVGPA